MYQYIYLTKRTNKETKQQQTIGGSFQARHSFEALHNARLLATQRGADNIRLLSLIKLN